MHLQMKGAINSTVFIKLPNYLKSFFFLLIALENKIHQFEEKEQQMKEEIELLHDLKQTLCSVQENRDLSSSSTSLSSLSS